MELTLVEHSKGDEVDAYERLLTDAMAGERLLFVREDAVDAAWAIVDPILDNATRVHPYAAEYLGPRPIQKTRRHVGRLAQPDLKVACC